MLNGAFAMGLESVVVRGGFVGLFCDVGGPRLADASRD